LASLKPSAFSSHSHAGLALALALFSLEEEEEEEEEDGRETEERGHLVKRTGEAEKREKREERGRIFPGRNFAMAPLPSSLSLKSLPLFVARLSPPPATSGQYPLTKGKKVLIKCIPPLGRRDRT